VGSFTPPRELRHLKQLLPGTQEEGTESHAGARSFRIPFCIHAELFGIASRHLSRKQLAKAGQSKVIGEKQRWLSACLNPECRIYPKMVCEGCPTRGPRAP
tara:strand:- start:3706 stop:4008 length:303 start_codon:yes stop_codon:yes gene_type:complete